MSRKPAITSLLNGQAVKVRFGFDQRHLQFADRSVAAPARSRAAKAAADHDDARGGLRADGHGNASDAAAAAMPRTTFLRVIWRSASMGTNPRR